MRNFNKYIAVIGLFCTGLTATAQSDGCSAATPLAVNANCSTPTAGTTAGATQTIPGCVGNADDDVWYSFVATSTSHQITVDGAVGFDAVAQLFSNTCSLLTSLNCQDATFDGGVETIFATGLTIGNTYRIRVYDYYAGSGTGNFTICVTVGPTAPSNDFCSNAIPLAVNGSCSYTSGTSLGATQTMAGCAGTADDDVWFSFVATNSVQTITVDPSSNMDPVIQLLDGACITFNSLYCEDAGFTNGNEVINAVGLNPGATYYVRVYDYYNATGGDAFDICVTGTATSAPVNDEPCNAILLPPVTAACDYLNFTTTGATASLGAPTPASCVGGSAPQQGGFSASSADVWFAITVPATGSVYVSPEPNSGINDAVMSLYSGTCGSLTQIACSDDNVSFPGAANDLKPYIAETGLTPGSTVYLRYWGYGTTQGDFGICVSSPTNDACVDALYICDINGYSASTSAAYTPDRPGTGAGQMYGNNELPDGTPQPNGTNTGGPFGGAVIDVEIDNNSWIQFTASATTATLTVSVYDCWVGNFPSGGIQMEVFSGTNCDNFVSVSNFEENSTGFVITATGLTIGQDYYLMVDGYAGDICSYTITADSGVQFPEITAAPETICAGASTTLTAPATASSYLWFPGGQTTQVITVNPSSTTTYTCIVEGVCDYKQTLTKTITVNQLPTMTSTSSPADICSGQSVGLNLISDLASTYSWVATANGNVGGESTSAQSGSTINDVLTNVTGSPQTVTYTVTPTSTPEGCLGNPQTVTVTVNPIPSALTLSSNTPVCVGDPINLTANTVGSGTYAWTGPNGFTSSLEDPTIASAVLASGGTYNATVTVAGCTSPSASTAVVVNAVPSALSLSSNTPVCVGDPINLTANTVGSGTYAWTGPNGFTSSSEDPTIASAVLASGGTYNATVTVAGCTSPSASTVVVVNAVPSALSLSSNTPVCEGDPINLTANTVGSGTYSWTGPNGFTSSSEDPTIASAVLASAGTYNATVTVAGCTSPSASTSVVVNPTPAALSISSNTPVCEGDPINFTANTVGSGTYSWTGPNGFTSSSEDPTIASSVLASGGTYNATVTVAGCTSPSASTSVVVNAVPSALTLSSNTPICEGDPINLTSSTVGSGIYSWTGPNGFTSSSEDPTIVVSVLADAGSYSATVSVAGCTSPSASTSVVVNAIDVPTFNYATGSTYCATGTDPVATITGTTGGGFTIDNGGVINASDGTVDLDASGIGSYTITYLTTGPCPLSSTASINITTAPDATFGYALPSYCATGNTTVVYPVGSSGGAFSATPAGLSINASDGSVDLSLSSAGVYTVTNNIVASGGCAADMATTSIEIFALPTVTASSTLPSICDGGSVTFNGGGATSYIWDNGVTDGVAFTPGSTGNTTYTVTGTDGNTCSNTATVDVFVNTLPTVVANANSVSICDGATLTLTGSGATSYTWDNSVTDGVAFTPAVGAVNYTVTGTDGNSCVNTDQISVNVNALPTVVANATSIAVCDGDPVTLSGSGATSYLWTGGVTDGVAFTPAVGVNNYTVTGTDGNTCSNTDAITVTVIAIDDPAFSYATGSTYCASGTDPVATITGLTGGTFTIDNGGSINAGDGTIDLGASGIGAYVVTYTTNGTCPTSANVNINITTAPDATFSYAQAAYCQVGTTSPSYPAGSSGGAFTATPAGLSIDGATGDIDLVNSAPGIYTVTNDIVASGGCAPAVATTDITVTAPDNDGFAYSSTAYCSTDPNQIPTIDVGGGTFAGTAGLLIDVNTGEIDVANTPFGTYDVTYTTNGTCINDSTVSVTISGQLDATIAVLGGALCETDAVITLTAADGGGTWSGNGVDVTTGDFDPQTAGVGVHTIFYEIVGSCGDIDSIDVVVNLTPNVTVVGDTICDGALPVLVATGNGGVINWYSDAGLTTLVASDTNTYSPALSEGIYTFYVQETLNGCSGSMDSANANVFDVSAAFVASPESGNVPLDVELTNTSFVVDTINDQFNWVFGNGETSIDFEPSVTFNEPGTFAITLTVTNEENMCSDIYTVDIVVTGEHTITVPNIFSPNGDGQNDIYAIMSENVVTLEAVVFDRWGLLMYEWNGINGGWNGRTKAGIEASEGTYFYLITYTDYKGDVFNLQGAFNLVR